jgi:hypothetical protein
MSDFWTSPSFEPKRAFRFKVRLALPDSPQAGGIEFLAKSVDRPSYTVSSNPHKFFNHTFHYPGRVEWNTISMTLVDAISPNASDVFMKLLRQIGYADPSGALVDSTSPIMTRTITKQSATSALGTVQIVEMGSGEGGEAEERGEWTLKNAFITEVNFGNHSYDSEEMIDIVLSIQYDWAAYNPK